MNANWKFQQHTDGMTADRFREMEQIMVEKRRHRRFGYWLIVVWCFAFFTIGLILGHWMG